MTPTGQFCCSFFVPGVPKAQPRARSFVLRGRGGKPILSKTGQPIIRVHEAGTAEHWKSQIAQAAKEFVPMPPLQGPLRVSIEFIFPRPKSHFRSNGDLKLNATHWHISRPDVENLKKAVFDALTTIGMWGDDCQICEDPGRKVYFTPSSDNRWGSAGALIRINQLPEPNQTAAPPPAKQTALFED